MPLLFLCVMYGYVRRPAESYILFTCTQIKSRGAFCVDVFHTPHALPQSKASAVQTALPLHLLWAACLPASIPLELLAELVQIHQASIAAMLC